MKSISTAYLLWTLGLGGCLGLHHFYLKNYRKGFLWLFTFGLFGVGAIYDLFTLAEQTNIYNVKVQLGIPKLEGNQSWFFF